MTKSQDIAVTALSVTGFKSIDTTQRIELRPITVLAGANSSGKSSMIQPLLLLNDYRLKPVDSFTTESRLAAEAA